MGAALGVAGASDSQAYVGSGTHVLAPRLLAGRGAGGRTCTRTSAGGCTTGVTAVAVRGGP